MNWTQIDITTTTAGIEPVGALLIQLGLGGYSVQDAADFQAFLDGKQGRWDYIDESLLHLREAPTVVTAYLAQNPQGAETLALVRDGLRRLQSLDADRQWGALALSESSIAEESWETAWKQYYHPVKVGERLVVCPSWEEYTPGENQVVIRLDPGMAFGTGTHDSTRLCMQLIEGFMRPDARVLDVGCGSGILAIAALLLGAREALGVDIDETAVRVAGENAARNGVEDRARFVAGDLARQATGRYGLVCANIVADVIIGFAPDAPALLEPEGTLIVSGIIDTREGEVAGALEAQGLRLAQRLEAGGWVAMAWTC